MSKLQKKRGIGKTKAKINIRIGHFNYRAKLSQAWLSLES